MQRFLSGMDASQPVTMRRTYIGYGEYAMRPGPSRAKNGRELYQRLDAGLGSAHSRPFANNTTVYRQLEAPRGTAWSDGTQDRVIIVQLHSTNIVRVWPDGTVRLYWDGWYTQTTHGRMNDFLPARYRVSGTKYPKLTVSPAGAWWGPDSRHYRADEGMLFIGPRGRVTDVAGDVPCYCLGTVANIDRELYGEEIRREERERRAYRKRMQRTPEQLEEERRRLEEQRAEAARREAARRAEWREGLPVAEKSAPLELVKLLVGDRITGGVVSNHDGSPWTVGEWRDEEVHAPCHGLNASRCVRDALSFIDRPRWVARVESAGHYHEGPSKVTADSQRIVALWYLEADAPCPAFVMGTRAPELVAEGGE
jgi:hypothetical protein